MYWIFPRAKKAYFEIMRFILRWLFVTISKKLKELKLQSCNV